MSMKYQKVIERIKSGTMARVDLMKLKIMRMGNWQVEI